MAGAGDDSGRSPASRSDVIAALRTHSISGDVAAELWRVAQNLQRRTRRRGLEHAVTLDVDSGEQIGSMLTGSSSATDLTPHLLAFRAGRTYVQLHSHPRSSSFSDLDIRLLSDHRPLATMVAIGNDGTWHLMSRTFDQAVASARTVEIDFLLELDTLRGNEIPNIERPHVAVERVTARHGWMYDRVRGQDNG